MLSRRSTPRLAAMLIAAGSGLALAAAPATAFASSGHHQTRHHDLKLNQVNLASDIPGMAPLTDPDLKNPWGISHSPTSPLWVSNQGTNSSTLYTLPPGPATETKATVPGAGYTGLAIASTSHGDRLFAANFAQGRIDVFNSGFHKVKTARWQFRDPRLPRGYLPFNTQALNGNIFVAYDKADPVTGRQAVGRHLGVVDEFSPDGRLISRITSGGALNAPWGLAIAPAS